MSIGFRSKEENKLSSLLELPAHLNTVYILTNSAAWYECKGQYDEALKVYSHALDIMQNALAHDHLDFVTLLNSMANLQKKLDRYDEALQSYAKIRDLISKRNAESDSMILSALLNNMASIYYHQEKYAKALECMEESKEIKSRELGTNHPGLAMILNNIALIEEDMGNHEQAKQSYQEALNILNILNRNSI